MHARHLVNAEPCINNPDPVTHVKVTWNEQCLESMRNKLTYCLNDMNQVIQSIDVRDKSSIDGAVNNFTTMLNYITSECKQQVCVNSKRTFVNKEDKPWFDNECKNLYNIYKTDLRRFNLYKSEGNRVILCESRMKYKKHCTRKKLETNSQRVIKFLFLGEEPQGVP